MCRRVLPLLYFGRVWELVSILFWMFGKIHQPCCLVLNFRLFAGFWLLSVQEWPSVGKREDWRLVSNLHNSFSSVQSLSCVFLQPPGLQHARLPCPSPTPRACSNSYQVGDAIQLSHPLSSPSLPALNLSQHQGLIKSVSSSHQVAKVLEFQLQHFFSMNFQWTLRIDLL